MHHVNHTYFELSIGYNPQNTIGFIFRYPAKGSVAGFSANVIVSPTLESPTFFIDAVKNQHLQQSVHERCVVFGVNTPVSTTSNSLPDRHHFNLIAWFNCTFHNTNIHNNSTIWIE